MKLTKKEKKKLFNQVFDNLKFHCKARQDNGITAGYLKADGLPSKTMLEAEAEFFVGAYTCLTFLMSKLEDITMDKAMKYFNPNVMFSIMGGDTLIDRKNKPSESWKDDLKKVSPNGWKAVK